MKIKRNKIQVKVIKKCCQRNVLPYNGTTFQILKNKLLALLKQRSSMTQTFKGIFIIEA